MMRLQRVGRRNDPSYRIVVTDKRTGPKSDKHIDRLGSYNPKLNHVQLDADKAKDWLAKGVQPSDTVHNILVKEAVIDAKKVNALPRKAPIVDEAAEAAKAEAEAEAAKAEAETADDAGEESSADAEPATAEESAAEAETEETEKAAA